MKLYQTKNGIIMKKASTISDFCDIKSFCSSNGKSIVLLNAVLKNNLEVVRSLMVSSTTCEKDQMINSIFFQEKCKITSGPVSLMWVAVNNNSNLSIIKLIESAMIDIEGMNKTSLLKEMLEDISVNDEAFIVDVSGALIANTHPQIDPYE